MSVEGLPAHLRAQERSVPVSRTRVCPDGPAFAPHGKDCTCRGTGMRKRPALSDEAIALECEPIPEGDPRGTRDHFVEGFDR